MLCLVALLDGPGKRTSISVDSHRNTDGTNDNESATSNDDAENSSVGIPLRSIEAVAAHVPFIEAARAKVMSEMENMVLTGLTTLVRSSPDSFKVITWFIITLDDSVLTSY